MKRKSDIISYLILSIIGGIIIVLITTFISSETESVTFFDKLIVGGVFISSCIYGISLAVRPNWTRRIINHGGHVNHKQQIQSKTRKSKGHHPDCEQFQGHTINIKNRVHCAGCTGLALGSTMSIFLTIIYLSLFKGTSRILFYILIILGFILISLIYVEIIYPRRRAFMHLMSNMFLVIAFFFVTIGVFQLTGSVVYSMFALIISFLWLDTRIQLSSLRHSIICRDCKKECKVY